jgi:hypothetical protein
MLREPYSFALTKNESDLLRSVLGHLLRGDFFEEAEAILAGRWTSLTNAEPRSKHTPKIVERSLSRLAE